MPAEEDRGAGLAAVVLSTVLFSGGFIIVKVVPLQAGVLAAWRVAIGAAVLGTAALALRTRWPRSSLVTVAAGLAFGVHQLLFILAVHATSVAIVTLIIALQPLVVSAVSRSAVGEAVSRRLVACAVLAVSGVVVVVLSNADDPSRSLTGDLLAVANLVAFTAYFLLAKRARGDGVPALTFTASFLAVSLVVLLPVALAGGTPLVPGGRDLALVALLALGPGNGHLLVNWAHRRVSAALSSLVLAGVPVLASVWAFLVLGEPLGWAHAVGITLVIGSIEGGRRAERHARLAAPLLPAGS